jgi:hypothetical protein
MFRKMLLAFPKPRKNPLPLSMSRHLFAGLLFLLAAAGPAAAAVLQPHSAAYQFKLVSARPGASVSDASGIMTYELSDACRGWASEQKTKLQLDLTSGDSVAFGWSTTAYEEKDGSAYRFFIEHFSDLTEEEKQNGRATLAADGSGGKAEITSGGLTRDVELPRGVLFPTAFTKKLIEAAEAGEVLLSGPLFDGSGDEGAYEVSVIIGKKRPAGSPAAYEALQGLDSWSVRAAFYNLGDQASVPEQEQSFRLFANGVIDGLQLDMGDFVVEGDLNDFELLPGAGC